MSLDFIQVEGSDLPFEMVYVNPNEVRFTQRSIACHFVEGSQGSSLAEVRDRIQRGSMRASDFPPMRVYKDENGTIWSKDNRRLWLFRMAGVRRIAVKLFVDPFFRMPSSSAQREEMRCSHYFPVLRGQGTGFRQYYQ